MVARQSSVGNGLIKMQIPGFCLSLMGLCESMEVASNLHFNPGLGSLTLLCLTLFHFPMQEEQSKDHLARENLELSAGKRIFRTLFSHEAETQDVFKKPLASLSACIPGRFRTLGAKAKLASQA